MFRHKIQANEYPVRRLLHGFFTVVLPFTILMCFVLLQQASVLRWDNGRCYQSSILVFIGMTISYCLFQGRLRFWAPTLLLLLLQWIVQGVLSGMSNGEFDFFTWYSAWIINSSLLGIGWLLGYSIQRFRLGVYVFSLLILISSLQALTIETGYSVDSFLMKIGPVFLGVVLGLMLFELWRTYNFSNQVALYRYWGRVGLILLVCTLFLAGIIRYYYRDIDARLHDYSHQQKSSEQLDKKKDGSFSNKQSMGLGMMNQRNKNPKPLFCAHIQLNFPDTDIPNPLYMVSYHFDRFDTLTETFERDTLFQYSDEFVPSPASYPFYQTVSDSLVFLPFDQLKQTDIVVTDVFALQLSRESFVAPSTAFSVQPIPVEQHFKSQFTSAYKATSKVSLLNSAYWVYNARDPMLQAFQEERFDLLRKCHGWESLPVAFMSYYASFPTHGIYAPIKKLADSLQQGKSTTLDKVLSVRDYFLQRRSDGTALYSYSDNPGIPGLPGASRLLYFMFESRKGYCAYYAASTVALLRSMGVPARVVTGFMTIDRSDKNKGWYWFYEDQAHAWVQVYFPGYGWMDFDTTVGNEDARESPKPDGTPPMEPPVPWLVLQGNLLKLDSLKHTMLLQVQEAVIQGKEFHWLKDTLLLDVSKKVFWKDSVRLTWRDIKVGDRLSAIAFASLDRLPVATSTWAMHRSKWASPLPVDEIYQLPSLTNLNNQNEWHDKHSILNTWFAFVVIFLAMTMLTILFLPWFTYRYLVWQSIRKKVSLYPMYRRLMFVFHMGGYSPINASIEQFASKIIDGTFSLNFSTWVTIYWAEKYAGKPLDSIKFDEAIINGEIIEGLFLNQLPVNIKRRMWFSLNRYIAFMQNNFFLKNKK